MKTFLLMLALATPAFADDESRPSFARYVKQAEPPQPRHLWDEIPTFARVAIPDRIMPPYVVVTPKPKVDPLKTFLRWLLLD